MTRNNRNEHQEREAAFVLAKPKLARVAKPIAGSQGKNNTFTHVNTCKSSEKHDVGTGSTEANANDSEESSADEELKSTHSVDTREVFDKMPDSDVEQPKKAPWTCYAKLHSVPVQGNRVKLEVKQLDNVDTTWGFCLVGRFAVSFPHRKQGVVQLCNSWDVPYKLFPHATTGWFVFRFENEQHREQVLLGGPYSVSGCTLLLKHMPPCFEFDSDPLTSVPVWIKLPGLPLDCWNPTALSMIASAVGNPISTDYHTRTKETISHARLLVEVDVTAELVTSIEIHLPNGRVRQQGVEFDFLPIRCGRCQRLGHSSQSCPYIKS